KAGDAEADRRVEQPERKLAQRAAGEADFLGDICEGGHRAALRYDAPGSSPSQAISLSSSFGTTNRSSRPECGWILLQSSSGKSITASAAVGDFSTKLRRGSTSPEAINDDAEAANAGVG